MTGSTPVVNITFHRSKLPEDPGYSEAHAVYDNLVWSLLLILMSPNCSVSSSTAAALDTVEFSRIPVLLKGSILVSAVEFQGKCMFEGCLSLTELEFFLVATRISGQDNPSVIKPAPLFG